MQQAFAAAGLQEPSEGAVNRVIGLSLKKAISMLLHEELHMESPLYQQITQAYRDYYRLAENDIDLFPDVVNTLKELRCRGYWLGVVTGKSRAGLLRVLASFDLHDLFYVWRTADCTHSKPHPAMVLECMQELGVTAEKTTVVGDACFDMQMAVAAGVRALGVSFGVSSADELIQAGADGVVNDFTDVPVHFPPLQDRLG